MRCNYLIVTKLLSQKCHSRGGLSATDVCSSWFEAVFSASSRQRQAHCWMRAGFLAHRPTVHCVFRWRKARNSLGSRLSGSDPIYEDKVLSQITPQVASHWGLGFQGVSCGVGGTTGTLKGPAVHPGTNTTPCVG